MSSRLLAQIVCDSGTHKDCPKAYPWPAATYTESGRTAGTTLTELRAQAAGAGWETMQGKHGRDACPQCRIAEIQFAQKTANTFAEPA